MSWDSSVFLANEFRNHAPLCKFFANWPFVVYRPKNILHNSLIYSPILGRIRMYVWQRCVFIFDLQTDWIYESNLALAPIINFDSCELYSTNRQIMQYFIRISTRKFLRKLSALIKLRKTYIKIISIYVQIIHRQTLRKQQHLIRSELIGIPIHTSSASFYLQKKKHVHSTINAWE